MVQCLRCGGLKCFYFNPCISLSPFLGSVHPRAMLSTTAIPLSCESPPSPYPPKKATKKKQDNELVFIHPSITSVTCQKVQVS